MYSERPHYCVHNKTNPTQTQGGRARRILISTKIIIIPAPTQKAGEDRAIPGAPTPFSPRHRRHRCRFPIPVVVVASATSPRRPWPSCAQFPPREQLFATAVGGPVVVMASSSPSPRRRGRRTVGGAGSLPVVLLLSPSPLLLSLLVCPFPPLAALLPVSTPRAVARSGGWPSSS
jgi:hypothetical protein